MNSAKIEALKGLALTLLTALASAGVIASNVPNIYAPVIAAVGALLAVFLVHPPQAVSDQNADQHLADVVRAAATSNTGERISVPVPPQPNPPSSVSITVLPSSQLPYPQGSPKPAQAPPVLDQSVGQVGQSNQGQVG